MPQYVATVDFYLMAKSTYQTQQKLRRAAREGLDHPFEEKEMSRG